MTASPLILDEVWAAARPDALAGYVPERGRRDAAAAAGDHRCRPTVPTGSVERLDRHPEVPPGCDHDWPVSMVPRRTRPGCGMERPSSA
jgi:hypothetical protein